MKIAFLLVAVSCLFASSTSIAADDVRSKMLCNGRLWMQLDTACKLSYVNAIRDLATYHKERDVKIVFPASGKEYDLYSYVELYYPTPWKGGDMIRQLDAFYSDTANRPIPILVAMRIATRRFYGAPEESVASVIDAARKDDYIVSGDER